VAPRAALAAAGDRRHAGRSGSDLIGAIAILLVAIQLRAIVQAVWLATAIDVGVGVRALVRVIDPLTVPLAVLVVSAGAIFAAAGPRRNLGRAFDLACVTALPIVIVELVAAVFALATGLAVPELAASIVAYGWTGVMVALAIVGTRRATRSVAPRHVRVAGLAFAALALGAFAMDAVWIARHSEAVRPMTTGDAAPPLSLARIGPNGALGEKLTLAPGKITVIDFWATWCNPCLRALPHLDAFARRHPEVDVIAIVLDEPGDARALFDERGYGLTLLADDGATSQRYGVTTIPHTVVIDREGHVRKVNREGELDLEKEIAALQP
jgi:thiol-disulfide isomerase/thioredoxin